MNILELTEKDIKIMTAHGEADFPMKKGSFRYIDRVTHRRHVTPEEIGLKISHEGDDRIYITCSDRLADGGSYNRLVLTIPVGADEHFYGCGETFSEFDLKGQNVRIWVAEHQNSKRITKKIIKQELFGKSPDKKLRFDKYESYYAQPTFVSSACYYVHVDGSGYAEFDFSKAGYITIRLRQNSRIEICSADTFTELSRKLSDRLGRQTVIPDWVHDGIILAVQEGTDTVQKAIDTALAADIKLVGIWSQDWCGCRRTGFGYQVMWNWEADDTLYHDLREKIPEWKSQGIRFLGYINPFMAIEKELYKYASAHGYCVKDKNGADYLVTITTFPAAMIDFTNPEAYEWYKQLIKENMIGIGMGGWMADFGEYLPADCVLFSGEDPQIKHNEWPAIWAKLNREALRECSVENEVFFFTRAGYTDTIKYSTMMWNGDQHVDWSLDDGLASVIPASLSLAMSGFGLTHSDVGGYTTIRNMVRSRELLMRWTEMNAFSPLMRCHQGNQPSRNVQFDCDEEMLAHFAAMTRVHVELADYLRECEKELFLNGTPVMRPLFYHYDEERAYTEDTEYLLGKDYLVAPVIKEGAVSREVYLPEDEWTHIWTGQKYTGGIIMVEAPIGRPPVFVRNKK